MSLRVIHGDSLDVLPTLETGSVDAVCTDPPYGLEFMGRGWDAPWKAGAGGMSSVGFREKRYKDGSTAMLPVSIGGTNPTCRNCGGLRSGSDHKKGQPACRCDNPTFDNILTPRAQAFQGWCQQWAEAALRVLKPGGYLLAFGSPRTVHRLTCAIEDAGFEIRDTILWLYGSGFPKGKGCLKPAYEPILLCRKPGPRVLPLGIDECRIGTNAGWSYPNGPGGSEPHHMERGELKGNGRAPQCAVAGRWPANVLHDGSDEVLEAFAAFGEKTSGGTPKRRNGMGYHGANGQDETDSNVSSNSGTAARFFYTAKASRAERGEGNSHPCVKPVALLRWLVRLVCPPGGTVLDPFLGSGTTLLACHAEDRNGIGIERDAGYCEIARKRLAEAEAQHPLFVEGKP